MKRPIFERDLKDGERAEEWVRDALFLDNLSLATKGKYYDMISDNEKIEVKYDMVAARTGNFFFEVISNIHVGNLGACLYSKADILCLVLDTKEEKKKEMLFISFEKLRFIAMKRMVEKSDAIRNVRGNEACYGILIPIKDIRDLANKKIFFEVK